MVASLNDLSVTTHTKETVKLNLNRFGGRVIGVDPQPISRLSAIGDIYVGEMPYVGGVP